MGSANYSQVAFGIGGSESRGEIMQKSDADSLLDYCNSVAAEAISCTDDLIHERVHLLDQMPPNDSKIINKKVDQVLPSDSLTESIDLPMLDSRTMETPMRSGINHGQRPDRDHSQAYIAIPKWIQDRDFFPAPKVQFTVVTDDGTTLLMARGGTGGKNMMTPEDNGILGRYLRKRLGLLEDAYVHTEDLERYGRVSVTFHKSDSETYFMDFSPIR